MIVRRPSLPTQPAPKLPTHGNFTLRDEFDGAKLAPYWLMIRTPRERWYELQHGALVLRARADDGALATDEDVTVTVSR